MIGHRWRPANAKTTTLTPERLRDRWHGEATAVGLEPGAGVDDLVVGRGLERRRCRMMPSCSRRWSIRRPACVRATPASAKPTWWNASRAISAGRLTTEEIVAVSERFLASGLVVRLAPSVERRRPPEWSTVEHRAVEDRLLAGLHALAATPRAPARSSVSSTGRSQPNPSSWVPIRPTRSQSLCGEGGALRALIAPAGFGKTTALHAAASAQLDAGRHVIALAPTHQAVAELRAAGLDAHTIARFLVGAARTSRYQPTRR